MENNMLIVARPTRDAILRAGCDKTCNDLGPADPLNKHELSPRPNREKVRGQIRDYVLNMLGAPAIRLELDEQNVQAAIDFALQVFEDYAPREYFQYYIFNTVPGKSVYELPPDVGMVRDIFYKETATFAFQSSDLGGAIPIEYFYPGGAYSSIQGGLIDPLQPIWGRMGEWVLYKQYEMMYSRAASNLGGWEWVGGLNNVKLYPIPYKVHPVIVHYLQTQPDFRRVTQAMQEGALAFAKIILGQIRTKIMNPPGPNGGIQLNGEKMLEAGERDKEKWEERLITRFGDLPPISMG